MEGVLSVTELASLIYIVGIDATMRGGKERWLQSDAVLLLGFTELDAFRVLQVAASDDVVYKVREWTTGVQCDLVLLSNF